MLVEFVIKNFRSYKDETIFSYEALPSDYRGDNIAEVSLSDGTRLRLLRTAVVFGANAAGKSNVIWALRTLRDMVRGSLRYDNDTGIPGYMPFLFDERCKNSPSEMTLKFVVSGDLYQYRVEFAKYILCESLSMMVCGKEKRVFRSDIDGATGVRTFSLGVDWRDLQTYIESGKLLPNQLVLSLLGTRDTDGLQRVYSYISTISAVTVNDVIHLKYNNQEVADNLLKGEDTKLSKRLERLIRIADTGIESIQMKRHSEGEFHFPASVPDELKEFIVSQNRWEFRMLHKIGDRRVALPMSLESTGTKNLFGVGARVLGVLEKGGMLAYDEMNIAIHPKLFELLLSLFNDSRCNPHNAQLLVTTHDVSVSNGLRADQIWFAEKKEGVSTLFSAQDFEDVGINIPFENWYKSGRFGALPEFGRKEYVFQDEKAE